MNLTATERAYCPSVITLYPVHELVEVTQITVEDRRFTVSRHRDRRRSSARFVTDEHGIIWTVNRHGVETRNVEDAPLPGWLVRVSTTQTAERSRLLRAAFRGDPTFKPCTCCAHIY